MLKRTTKSWIMSGFLWSSTLYLLYMPFGQLVPISSFSLSPNSFTAVRSPIEPQCSAPFPGSQSTWAHGAWPTTWKRSSQYFASLDSSTFQTQQQVLQKTTSGCFTYVDSFPLPSELQPPSISSQFTFTNSSFYVKPTTQSLSLLGNLYSPGLSF